MSPSKPEKLVIAGGGHASLPLLNMGLHRKNENLRVTLVSAEPYLVYSGALPQYMGGFYNFGQTSVNLKLLCESNNVTFIRDKVTGINNSEKTIVTSSGEILEYDYLVINVGAVTTDQTDSNKIFPVKPMPKLFSLRDKLENGTINKLLIAGAGAAGTEIALNLSHPDSFWKNSVHITLLEKSSRILSAFPEKASKISASILKDRGVIIQTDQNFDKEMTEQFDAVMLATGNEPESLSIQHPFESDNNGRILTEPTLLVKGEDRVFAAGDTANVGGKNHSQIGVHAVKQGLLLRKNIIRQTDGKNLKPYKAYPVNPLIISDGPDNAIFIAGNFCFSGKHAATLKYMLDMRWLESYRVKTTKRRSWIRLWTDGNKRRSNFSKTSHSL
jgi:NADH dehydrogenase FAD-containing subunit